MTIESRNKRLWKLIKEKRKGDKNTKRKWKENRKIIFVCFISWSKINTTYKSKTFVRATMKILVAITTWNSEFVQALLRMYNIVNVQSCAWDIHV
jgi:hypothetical protein